MRCTLGSDGPAPIGQFHTANTEPLVPKPGVWRCHDNAAAAATPTPASVRGSGALFRVFSSEQTCSGEFGWLFFILLTRVNTPGLRTCLTCAMRALGFQPDGAVMERLGL